MLFTSPGLLAITVFACAISAAVGGQQAYCVHDLEPKDLHIPIADCFSALNDWPTVKNHADRVIYSDFKTHGNCTLRVVTYHPIPGDKAFPKMQAHAVIQTAYDNCIAKGKLGSALSLQDGRTLTLAIYPGQTQKGSNI